MNEALGLKVLGDIMGWDNARAQDEFAWLRLMSTMKYDAYDDFIAGVRFVESFASWLQQFERDEREVAYDFVRNRLVFVSGAEMAHLVRLAFRETFQRRLVKEVATETGIAQHLIWSNETSVAAYNRLLRQSLFMGLSDGARIDVFRRANAGIVSNEQVVIATQIDSQKWNNLLKKLRNDINDGGARFRFIFLIDDFVGSGATLLRNEEGDWKGKLIKFWENISDEDRITTHCTENLVVGVHHYLATQRARDDVQKAYDQARDQKNKDTWFQNLEFSFGAVFPSGLPLDAGNDADFMKLIDRCYDASMETSHHDVGGEGAKLGFGKCALPLVLEHNTPNNSIALLWAETKGVAGAHAMRPLFRRRERHS